MRKRLDYVLLFILLAAVLVTGIVDSRIMGSPREFETKDAKQYLAISYHEVSSTGLISVFRFNVENISSSKLKNISMTMVTSGGNQKQHIDYLEPNEVSEFEIIVVSGSAINGLPGSPKVLRLEVEGEIMR